MSEHEPQTQTQPGPPPPAGPPPRRYPPLHELHRSRTDRKLLGVAGGLGRYAGIDPLIFRILFVVLAIFGGSGILLYALGWLLVPDDGEEFSEAQRLFNGSARRSTVSTVVAGVVAVLVGLFLVGNLLHTGPGLGGLGAVIVVAAIVALVARSGPQPVTNQAPQQAYGPVPPPEPGAYGQTPGTAYAVTAPVPPVPPAYIPPPYYVPPPPPPPRPRKERSILGRVTVSAALIVVGLMVAWNASTDHDIKAVAVLASALAVVGAGLVVGAFRGRARGLIVLGILLALVTSITAVADDRIVGGLGQRDWAPTGVHNTHRDYRLGIGEGRLDLTHVRSGRTFAVDARVGIGHLQIDVPADATVHITAHVDAGEMEIPGQPTLSDDDIDRVVTLQPVAGSSPSGKDITINAKVGFGQLEVRRASS
jgi:phage shock protein PspC (stress-responsive transcriptional regulator)